MVDQSPAAFARKLQRTTKAVGSVQGRAIAARAQVTKRFIVEAALTRNRNARPSWVQYRIAGDVAALRLRGGMGHLTELGSHHALDGWDETPRAVTHRRRKAAAKRGVDLAEAQALRTPWGPKSSVHHPALAARPFWRKGLTASREPGRKAYQRVVHETITTSLR